MMGSKIIGVSRRTIAFEVVYRTDDDGTVKPNAPLITYLVRAPPSVLDVPLCSRKFPCPFSPDSSLGRPSNVNSNQFLVSLTVPRHADMARVTVQDSAAFQFDPRLLC